MNARGAPDLATPGGRLRALAEAAGLTQAALADGLAIDQTGVSRLYAGKVGMTVQVAERAADMVGTTPEWLLFGDRAGDDAIRMAREEGRRAGLLVAVAILQELVASTPLPSGEEQSDPMPVDQAEAYFQEAMRIDPPAPADARPRRRKGA